MTDKQLNKDIKGYIREIKSYLICDHKTQRKFINDFKNDVYDYIEENSVNGINSVREHFGEAEKIAKGFIENADTRKIKKRMNIRNAITAGIIIALFIWAVGVLTVVVDDIYHPGYIVDGMEDGVVYGEVIGDEK